MIKAVLFDYGGVIKVGHVLSLDLAKIFDISEEEVKIKKEEINKVGEQASKGTITDDQLFLKISEILDKPLPRNYLAMAKKLYSDTFVFIPEILDLAKNLKLRGIKTAVLSNIGKFHSDVTREKNGYDEFDPVILSYEVKMRKPEPEIYKLALEKVGAKPEECIFIDDKEENLVPARQLGIATVLAKEPSQIVRDVMAIIAKN